MGRSVRRNVQAGGEVEEGRQRCQGHAEALLSPVEVFTLKGARTPYKALQALEEAIDEHSYLVVILGRYDAKLAELE